MGTSPAAYLAEVRMQEAHALLRDNEVSVAQIAERLGYATEAAFRRAFRRVVGATPGDVRHRRSFTPHLSD
jgi:AraC-like DNA-binding protein